MRMNPIVLVITVLIGVVGIAFSVRAYTTYEDAAEAFTRIELRYVPDSFQWEDSDFEEGTARFLVVNDSRFSATVESFNISLRFDGRFAGSDYDRWQQVVVSGNEVVEIPTRFTVTANSIQHEGGTANIGFAGQLVVRFNEFEQPLSFRFGGDIGEVGYEGSR